MRPSNKSSLAHSLCDGGGARQLRTLREVDVRIGRAYHGSWHANIDANTRTIDILRQQLPLIIDSSCCSTVFVCVWRWRGTNTMAPANASAVGVPPDAKGQRLRPAHGATVASRTVFCVLAACAAALQCGGAAAVARIMIPHKCWNTLVTVVPSFPVATPGYMSVCTYRRHVCWQRTP